MFKLNLLISILFFSYFSSSDSELCDKFFETAMEITSEEAADISETAQREGMDLEVLLKFTKQSKEAFTDRMYKHKNLEILSEELRKAKYIFSKARELTLEEARNHDFFIEATALTPEEAIAISKISERTKMDVEFLLKQTKKTKERLFLNMIKKYDIEDIERLKTEKVTTVMGGMVFPIGLILLIIIGGII